MYKNKPHRTIILSRSKYGLTGVTKFYNDWKASIKVNNKVHTIGIYASALEAHQAYKKTAHALGIKLHIIK